MRDRPSLHHYIYLPTPIPHRLATIYDTNDLQIFFTIKLGVVESSSDSIRLARIESIRIFQVKIYLNQTSKVSTQHDD